MSEFIWVIKKCIEIQIKGVKEQINSKKYPALYNVALDTG